MPESAGRRGLLVDAHRTEQLPTLGCPHQQRPAGARYSLVRSPQLTIPAIDLAALRRES